MDEEFEKKYGGSETDNADVNGTKNNDYVFNEPHSAQGSQPYNESAKQEGTTYYTPPVREESAQPNTTYHYSYVNENRNRYNSGRQENSAYNGYSPYSQPAGNASSPDYENPKPPKKKNNTVKIVTAVLVVCVVIAIAGLVASVAGIAGKNDTDNDKNGAAQSQSSDDVKTQDSAAVPTKDGNGVLTVAGVAEECKDSCVGITVYTTKTNAYDYFYNYGNNQSNGGPSKSGEGSGILMKEDNGKTYVLTCAHVISDGDEFTVTLNDGTECEAQMVAYDAQTDIGVISINKTGLKIAEFADSENVVVGEQVVAIGCPGGLEFLNSVTSGYISALARPVSSSIGYDTDCIQTDTAINPGNSGGALFNMQGQVIGVNSSKIASTEYEGMGFAVPSVTALETANSLIKAGYVEGRAKLGITYNVITSFNNSQAVIQALAQKGFEGAEGTMVINDVSDDSDLKNKDVQQYDMIVAVNGKTLTSTDVMTSLLADSKPGDKITLTIARIDNNQISTREVECTLIESKG